MGELVSYKTISSYLCVKYRIQVGVRRLDDPMPPTAARQQSAIFYRVSLQQRYADCPFATIVYIICADSVNSGASSCCTLQKYLLKESFFIQIFLRYVQLPTKKFPRGAIILFYLLFLCLYAFILEQIFQALGRRWAECGLREYERAVCGDIDIKSVLCDADFLYL